jgi:hypothetical protein
MSCPPMWMFNFNKLKSKVPHRKLVLETLYLGIMSEFGWRRRKIERTYVKTVGLMTFRVLHRLYPAVGQTEEYRSPCSLTCVPSALFSKIKRHLNSNALIITIYFLRNKPHKNNFRKGFYETESSSLSNVYICIFTCQRNCNFLHYTDYLLSTIVWKYSLSLLTINKFP